MSREARVAPADEVTGLPLSIFYGRQHLHLPSNYQHGWHSTTRIAKHLPNTWGKALRSSIGFKIPIAFHVAESQQGYHHHVDEGPDLPQTIDNVFRLVSLGAGRAVSRKTIDLTREPGAYVERTLTNREHEFLSHPSRVFIENDHRRYPARESSRDNIGRFFTEFAIRQAFEHSALSPAEEELLFDCRQPLTREMGAIAYSSTIETLNDLLPPVDAIFKQAKTEGMIADRRADIRSIVLSFVPAHKFGNYYYSARDAIFDEQPLQTGVDEVKLAA